MLVLIINAILYLFTTIYCVRKDGIISCRVFVSIMFFVFALMGVITINNGIYFGTFGYYNLSNISILPYLFNYILIFFLLSLLKRKIVKKQFTLILQNTFYINQKIVNIFELFVVSICAIVLILGFKALFENASLSYADVYIEIRNGEKETYLQNAILNSIFLKSHTALLFLSPFVYILEICKCFNRYKRKKALSIIIILFVSLFLVCIVSANRGGIFFGVLRVLFFIFIVWDLLPHKLKKQFMILGLFAAVIVLFFVGNISRDRLDDNVMVGNIRYFGEAFPNLGLRIWDVLGSHLWGERKFPTFYEMFGGNIPSFDNRGVMVQYFELKSNYPVDNFKTFFGDIYIEFGYMSFLVFFVYYGVIKFLINKYSNTGLSMIWLYCVYEMLIWGLFGCKLEERTLLNYLGYFIMIIFVKQLFKKVKTTISINNG